MTNNVPIRAYNTADGSGDEGLSLSFDLTKRFSDEFYAGVLYDYGWVRLAKNPLASTTVNTYSLQGAGIQFGGAANRLNWNVSVAKSFGEGQDTRLDSNLTQVGDWRINFEVTRAF
jgi:hemolysin activation/secretion protein